MSMQRVDMSHRWVCVCQCDCARERESDTPFNICRKTLYEPIKQTAHNSLDGNFVEQIGQTLSFFFSFFLVSPAIVCRPFSLHLQIRVWCSSHRTMPLLRIWFHGIQSILHAFAFISTPRSNDGHRLLALCLIFLWPSLLLWSAKFSHFPMEIVCELFETWLNYLSILTDNRRERLLWRTPK